MRAPHPRTGMDLLRSTLEALVAVDASSHMHDPNVTQKGCGHNHGVCSHRLVCCVLSVDFDPAHSHSIQYGTCTLVLRDTRSQRDNTIVETDSMLEKPHQDAENKC